MVIISGVPIFRFFTVSFEKLRKIVPPNSSNTPFYLELCLYRLILLHSEQPKLYGVLAVLSAIGLNINYLKIISSASTYPTLTYLSDLVEV